jgi:hypothetical protein
MKKGLTSMLIVLLCAWTLTMSGCGGGGSSSGDSSTPAALTTFGADVAECTPQLASGESEGFAEDISSEDGSTITDWTGWNPAAQYTILNNLLTPDCVEGMFDPIDKADMIINALNELQDYWQTDGVYQDVTVPLEIAGTTATLNVTMTVDTSVKSITVPFFGSTQAVDREITLEGTIARDGDSDNIDAEIAFATTDAGEVVVARTVFEDKGETSMFYGSKADGELDAWAACYVDEGTPGVSSEDFHVALKWHGNPSEKVFALTQYKGSNEHETKILAGGHADGDMAFLASSTDDLIDNTNPYYLICTPDILDGSSLVVPDVYIGTGLAADTSNAVLNYIKDGNASCLGYLDSYPADASDVQTMN